ncbi:uncharacterized protein EV422DRAFT_492631, partial [Fimicolochytrium jonesii]|uniref:uncharacterized protein n=1 Tax=Fimicolochytrium jonesii TaxID=1396493 RepID=UPI0022FDF00D
MFSSRSRRAQSTPIVPRHSFAVLQTKKRDAKFVLQTAEFYGADFSAPVENAAVVEIHQHSKPLDDAQLFEQEQTRAVQGDVFINALSNVAHSRIHPEDTQTQFPTALAEPSIPIPPPFPLSQITEADKQFTKSVIRETIPSIDYSDVFPDDIATRPGITVFRIESLKPVIIGKSKVGKFCVGDCYIILQNTPRTGGVNASLEGEGMDHKLWVWIGMEAEVDKRFCVALYGAGLRNWVHASGSVDRETSGDESPEFMALFGGRFSVDDDVADAAESGLFVAEKKRYPLRLYMLCGNKEIKLRLMDPAFWSLKTTAVFLLDWGLEIYQWNGGAASLNQKAKCRMLTERINRSERQGRAEVYEINEWDEPARFWELLGGQRTVQDAIEDHENDPSSDEALFMSIAMAPATLYRAFVELADDVQGHVVSVGALSRAMLSSDGAYVLDVGVELFVWIGKAASMDLRPMATELLARIVPLKKRPSWIGLHKLMEDHEAEVFKLRFSDW